MHMNTYYRTIKYEEKYGQLSVPEGFLKQLAGLSVEEQLDRYRWIWNRDVDIDGYPSYFNDLKDYVKKPDERTVIIKDGIVVGVYFYSTEQYPGDFYILPYQSVYYYCNDNNGAGYKTSESKRTFIC